jgi:3-deoxy-7-phosphoheptulonate synthase
MEKLHRIAATKLSGQGMCGDTAHCVNVWVVYLQRLLALLVSGVGGFSNIVDSSNMYDVQDALDKGVAEIASMPPLVFAGECRTLQDRLAAAARGDAFIVQGGDCAESFDQFNANRIRDLYRLILQMSLVVMYGGGVPVVKIGRLAGQFAKPRSADLEKKGDVELPSYRGDIINGPEFTPEARIPDPQRLVKAYHQSAATLNLVRGFSTGGYAALDRVADWNLDFMSNSDEGEAYLDLAKRVKEALVFVKACGAQELSTLFNETEFFVSHECLLLDYEGALTRVDSTTGLYYGCSGHFLWCGERTRQLDNAHVEYLKGIGNPIGVKVSDKMDPSELVALIAALNPENTPGRLAVIVRMGAAKLRENFPRLIQAVQEAGQTVTWVCDPMHGNTESCNGYKTRRYDNVRAEVEAFFDVHQEMGSIPGGVHLEMTGDDVTECIGGGSSVSETDLDSRYHTHCDPRLNAEQALEMAFYVASRLRERRKHD